MELNITNTILSKTAKLHLFFEAINYASCDTLQMTHDSSVLKGLYIIIKNLFVCEENLWGFLLPEPN